MKNANDGLYAPPAAKWNFGLLARLSASFMAILDRPIGLRVYGAGAAALGLVGIAWGDFALVWQPVPPGVRGRTALAYLAATALLLAGAAVQWRRTARLGIIALSILYALCVSLLHIPRVVAHPSVLTTWAGVAEQLALVAAGLVALSGSTGRTTKQLAPSGRILFALCLFFFGLVHFVYASATASFVPKWVPPGQLFWAYATGLAHWAACLALLLGVLAKAAARLLTVMFIVFSLVVHVPSLLADPSHFSWAANAMNLALIGAAWLIADSLTVSGTRAK